MDIRDYLRVFRAGKALLLVGVLLGGGVAAGISLALPDEYTATSELFVSTSGSSDLAQAVQGSQYAEQKVASYAKLLTSKELATAVVQDLDLNLHPDELAGAIQADVVKDTTILDVSVTDRSPQRARDIAASVDSQFQSMVERMESTPGQAVTPVRVSVVATPEVPSSPSSPKLVANIALGVVVGLVLAGGLALLRDRLDTTVKDDAVAAEKGGAPVIGHIPLDPQLAEAHVIELHSTSATAEAVRQILTNLAFVDVDNPPRSIMVTSSVSGEGKTTLAVNLAVALAESGDSVALVEADLRRPRVTRYLGLVAGAGLSNVLSRSAALEDVLQDAGDGLTVLPAGPIPPNPSQLLSSAAMAALVEQLRGKYDMVVIDSPPVLPVADASVMTRLVDGVVLCARWGTVTTAQLERTSAAFGRLGARLLGLVVTAVPGRAAPVAYGYGREVERRPRHRFRSDFGQEALPLASGPVDGT